MDEFSIFIPTLNLIKVQSGLYGDRLCNYLGRYERP